MNLKPRNLTIVSSIGGVLLILFLSLWPYGLKTLPFGLLRKTEDLGTTLELIVVRKGVDVGGVPTDVEIKRLNPAVHSGLNLDPKQLAEIDRVPELRGVARTLHPQSISLEELKTWVCRDNQSDVTMEALEEMKQDEAKNPERYDHWIRYLIFFTQENLKAMYIVYNFEKAEPSGPLVVGTYIWEDGRWKSWASNFDKMKAFQNAFDIPYANNLDKFFKK